MSDQADRDQRLSESARSVLMVINITCEMPGTVFSSTGAGQEQEMIIFTIGVL